MEEELEKEGINIVGEWAVHLHNYLSQNFPREDWELALGWILSYVITRYHRNCNYYLSMPVNMN